MNELNLIVSTRALTIKFPTLSKVRYMRGEQHLVRCYYEDIIKIGAKGNKVKVVSGGSPRLTSEKGVSHDLDPCEVDCDRATGPVGELEDVPVNSANAERCLKLGKDLALDVKSQLIDFLKANLDVFAWNHNDM